MKNTVTARIRSIATVGTVLGAPTVTTEHPLSAA
jgi:hypothetical protein